MTVDEIIKKLKSGVLDSPEELANYLVVLSAYLYQSSELETVAEIKYAAEWALMKEMSDYTDKLVDAKCKQLPVYMDWQRARYTTKTILECIRSLKKKLSVTKAEFIEGQNY